MYGHGTYAIYCGKTYKAQREGNGIIRLFSSDLEDLKIGFQLKKYPDHYPAKIKNRKDPYKDVPITECDSVYEISTYGVYKGYKGQLFRETEDTYTINLDQDVYRELGGKEVERGVYEKVISKKEVEVVEEKKIIYEKE